MDIEQLVKAAVVLIVGFGLRQFLALIGFELDPSVFDALVAAIATWFVGLFFHNSIKAAYFGIKRRLAG